MTSTVRRIATACAALALLTLTACGQSAADAPAADAGTLVFAAVPSEQSTTLKQSYEPLLAMLEKETGMTIEFQNATDYAAVIEGMRAGQIDIAQYGPFSYVLAKNQADGITPIASSVKRRAESRATSPTASPRPDRGSPTSPDSPAAPSASSTPTPPPDTSTRRPGSSRQASTR
jgi:phosphonate transport system substrate-binding protein